MAVAAYSAWQRAGRPVTPAQPIRDIVTRLKVAFPLGAEAALFGWGANEAHYTAVPAEDHTPFSQTGWPLPSPQWWVFATDIMHRVDLGVDCNVLFAYWLVEARAGHMPWLKYMNWQGKQYRAKGYEGETVAFQRAWANSGHFDHIHLSARTDYRDAGLGSWSLIPGGDMSEQDVADIKTRLGGIEGTLEWLAWRGDALAKGLDEVAGGPGKDEEMWTVVTLKDLLARSTEPVTVDAVTVADALAADPALVDRIAEAVAAKLAARLEA